VKIFFSIMKKAILFLLLALPLLSATPADTTSCACHGDSCITQPLAVTVLKEAKDYFGTNLGTLVSGWNNGTVRIEHSEKNVFRVEYGGTSFTVAVDVE
jgi:hypothetical protein